MSQHRQIEKKRRTKGFSLLEAVVAIGVVTIGIGGLAALVANSVAVGAHSKYVGLASTLASEKMEDIERWPAADPHVAVTGTSAGSLTADTGPVDVTSNGTTEPVNYYDNVMISTGGGSFSETFTSLNSGGTVNYTTTSITPNGETPTTTQSTTAPTTPITFDRRWLIEVNPTINGTVVNGVRRITVWVQSSSDAIQPPVNFQMSTVRP
jgi:Tfp pilus assembly protein PilV